MPRATHIRLAEIMRPAGSRLSMALYQVLPQNASAINAMGKQFSQLSFGIYFQSSTQIALGGKKKKSINKTAKIIETDGII